MDPLCYLALLDRANFTGLFREAVSKPTFASKWSSLYLVYYTDDIYTIYTCVFGETRLHLFTPIAPDSKIQRNFFKHVRIVAVELFY